MLLFRPEYKKLALQIVLLNVQFPMFSSSELAISPLDNSLHFIDDNVVLKLTSDGRVSIVAGRPLHCPPVRQGVDVSLATSATLVEPQSLTFAPNGDLFVAESDSQVWLFYAMQNKTFFFSI